MPKCFLYISRKRVDACFSIEIFAGYAWPITQLLLLWPAGGFPLGIPFVCYDVTPLPANAPPPPSEPTNHGDSRQAVVLHMRYKFGPITASFHFSSSFRRENIHMLLSSFLLSVLYAFVHAFQVSKQGARHVIFCSSIPASLYAHARTNKSFSILWQMADWMFEKALAAIKSPPSIPLDTLLSPVGLRLGDIRFAKIQMNLHM